MVGNPGVPARKVLFARAGERFAKKWTIDRWNDEKCRRVTLLRAASSVFHYRRVRFERVQFVAGSKKNRSSSSAGLGGGVNRERVYAEAIVQDNIYIT